MRVAVDGSESVAVPLTAKLPRLLWGDLVKWAAGYRCDECGKDPEMLKLLGGSGELHAHHVDKNPANNILANGRCLCPRCHQTIHARDVVGRPCEPGCTCGRHRKPSKPFGSPDLPGGSERCASGCKCGKHKARHLGARRFKQPCTRCGRDTNRVRPGLCATCLHNDWYHRNREAVNSARRRT
jgi:hypothetical protein